MTTTVAASILAVAAVGTADADSTTTPSVLFSTISPNVTLADSARCNNSGADCGWTVYDGFTLATGATITSFSYYSNFSTDVRIPGLSKDRIGSSTDYASTNWSIWSTNESGNGPEPNAPIVSATTVGTNVSEQGFTLTTVGISQYLDAGTYWIGFQNNLRDNENAGNSQYLYSDYVAPSNELATAYFGKSAPSAPGSAQAAFSIDGVAGDSGQGGGNVPGAPELSTWVMMLVGFAGLGWAERRRFVRRPLGV